MRENLKSSNIAQKVQTNARIVVFFRKAGDWAAQVWYYKEPEIEYYLWII